MQTKYPYTLNETKILEEPTPPWVSQQKLKRVIMVNWSHSCWKANQEIIPSDSRYYPKSRTTKVDRLDKGARRRRHHETRAWHLSRFSHGFFWHRELALWGRLVLQTGKKLELELERAATIVWNATADKRCHIWSSDANIKEATTTSFFSSSFWLCPLSPLVTTQEAACCRENPWVWFTKSQLCHPRTEHRRTTLKPRQQANCNHPFRPLECTFSTLSSLFPGFPPIWPPSLEAMLCYARQAFWWWSLKQCFRYHVISHHIHKP